MQAILVMLSLVTVLTGLQYFAVQKTNVDKEKYVYVLFGAVIGWMPVAIFVHSSSIDSFSLFDHRSFWEWIGVLISGYIKTPLLIVELFTELFNANWIDVAWDLLFITVSLFVGIYINMQSYWGTISYIGNLRYAILAFILSFVSLLIIGILWGLYTYPPDSFLSFIIMVAAFIAVFGGGGKLIVVIIGG